MHGDRRLPAACHSLYNHAAVRRLADNIILFLLDCGDNLAEHGLLVFRQIFCQQLIVRDHLRIVEVNQPIPVYLVSALPLQINRILSSAWRKIAALSEPVFVIHIGNRRPPIHHKNMGRILHNTALSQIEGFLRTLAPAVVLLNIDPPEIRLFHCPQTFCKRDLHIFVHCDCVGELRKNLQIIIMVAFVHILDFRIHAPDLHLIHLSIGSYHLDAFSQMALLIGPAQCICPFAFF